MSRYSRYLDSPRPSPLTGEGGLLSGFDRVPRLVILGWMISLVLGLYVIRLWQLQFFEGGSYQAQADQQRSRLIFISPPRGVIFDRNGRPLVRNIPDYNVTITPGMLPEDSERERAVLERLAQIIGMPYSSEHRQDAPPYQPELWTVGRAQSPPVGERPDPGILEMVDEVRYLRPYSPLVVARNLDRETALLVAQEGGVTMPGVGVEVVSRRNYLSGTLTSQVIGFLGPVPAEQVADFEAQGYNPNVDRIGYAGIEMVSEELLRGVPGRRYVEEDVLGQELSVNIEMPPRSGDNVYLTLDFELQRVADAALRAALERTGSRRGVVLAMDPRDGQILVMVSYPTFDNNLFSGKIDMEALGLIQEDVHRPLINHAIADQVPSGSVFKVIPATAALQEGIINRYTSVSCPGRILLPNKLAPDDAALAQPFYCWNRSGHGSVNVTEALAQSCDVFFYEVGGGFEPNDFTGIGVQTLKEYALAFGLGSVTGVDAPEYAEAAGLVPDSDWKRHTYKQTWTTGDTYNLSIGQGALLVTPIQMVNVMATVANRGTLYRPQLIHHITAPDGNIVRTFQPEVIRQLPVDAAVWDVIHEGLEATVDHGSAPRAKIEGVRVAGKTGTAEYCDDLAIKAKLCPVPADKTLPTHAWFMAYAPAEAPELVVLAWIYNGGEGSTFAVPVVHDVMDYYFKRKAGTIDPSSYYTPTLSLTPTPMP